MTRPTSALARSVQAVSQRRGRNVPAALQSRQARKTDRGRPQSARDPVLLRGDRAGGAWWRCSSRAVRRRTSTIHPWRASWRASPLQDSFLPGMIKEAMVSRWRERCLAETLREGLRVTVIELITRPAVVRQKPAPPGALAMRWRRGSSTEPPARGRRNSLPDRLRGEQSAPRCGDGRSPRPAAPPCRRPSLPVSSRW